jgi:hypothetical protein
VTLNAASASRTARLGQNLKERFERDGKSR